MTATTLAPTPSWPRPGLRHLTHSEWHKLRTTRSTMWTAAVAAAVAVTLSALHMRSAATVPALRADLDVVGASLFGISVAQYIAAIAGVLAISNEYASGTIHLSLAATPNRIRFLATKLGLTAGTAFGYGALVAVSSYALGRLILGHNTHPVLDASTARRLLAVAGVFAAMTLIGLGFGALLRSTAGGLVATAALFVVPKLLTDPLPAHTGAHITRYLPLQVIDDLVAAHPGAHQLGAAAALPVLAAEIAVLLIIAALVFRRRDV
jgi:ABC-2 type transport system permease protein